MVAIVGQSGAGKSTLLHILGALDAPSAGTVYCASTNVAQLSPRQAAAFRNREIGYVWQFHYLLPEFTALENVAMPLLARGVTQARGADSGGKLAEGGRLGRSRQPSAGRASAAASSSAWRWRVRWSTIPGCCWPTSPPATWTKPPPARVFDLIERLHASHGLTSILVTHNLIWPRAVRGPCALKAAGSHHWQPNRQAGLQAGGRLIENAPFRQFLSLI